MKRFKKGVKDRWYLYLITIVVLGAFLFFFGCSLSRLGEESSRQRQKMGEEAYQSYLSQFEQIDAQTQEVASSWNNGQIASPPIAITIQFQQNEEESTVLAQREDIILEYKLTSDEKTMLTLKKPPMSYEEYHRIASEKLNQLRVQMWMDSAILLVLGAFEILFMIEFLESLEKGKNSHNDFY